jgi:hypothetical protein
MKDLFTGLITSKTRIRILMRLFLNPEGNAYLRELADEFAVSPSQVKDELSQLSQPPACSRARSRGGRSTTAPTRGTRCSPSCTRWCTRRWGWTASSTA